MKENSETQKNIELKDLITPDEESSQNIEKSNENESKDNQTKQLQIYIYIPLILSAFIYMVLNISNFMIQIDPDYLLKTTNFDNTSINSNKIKLNKSSQEFIMIISLVNMLSKALGYIITNIKIFKKKINYILLFFIGIAIFCNIFLFCNKTTIEIIFIIHIFLAFSSGLFFVPLLRINWSFLPFNEGLVSGAFNGFEYFSIFFLSLINRLLELKYLFLINSFFYLVIFIMIIYLNHKYKGFFYGKYSYLYFSLGQKNEKTDPNLVENLIKAEEDEKNKEKNKENKKEKLKNSENDEKMEQFETDKEDEESSKENDENKKVFLQNLLSDITSKRFILLIISYLFLLSSNYIISLIYLPFSIIFNLKMLLSSSIHLTIYILIYSLSSLFFGISFDLKSIRYLIDRLILLSLLSIVLFFPTKYYSYILDLLSIINAVCLSGIKAIIYPLVYREFFNSEGNYYLISIFLFAEIIIYFFTPIFLKYFAFEITDFIMIFISCMAMLLGGVFIMAKKLFPIFIVTNENYDINTKQGQGLIELSLQDELPPLSKE